MSPSRTLTTTIHYRFQDGTTRPFTGKPCYRLSNSFRDAISQAKKACEERRERFSHDNVLTID